MNYVHYAWTTTLVKKCRRKHEKTPVKKKKTGERLVETAKWAKSRGNKTQDTVYEIDFLVQLFRRLSVTGRHERSSISIIINLIISNNVRAGSCVSVCKDT